MSDRELSAKDAYFKEQALLDLSNDEQDFPDESFERLERALADSMRSPKLVKQTSSFLGPTPKERQAEFDTHTKRKRATLRQEANEMVRPSTGPESEPTESFPITRPPSDHDQKLKRISSLPEFTGKGLFPFYKQMGVVPRELKSGKKVRPADKIKLEPEHKQLLHGKVVYFYPNDDISMVRRTRIHKVIQLGAAWVNRWRDDITHVMLDDSSYTYSQLLRHLNRAGFPKRVVLVKFDPYVPQCIQFGTLLDPNAQRFTVKGAPQRPPGQEAESSQSSGPSQTSLQIKPSRRQIAAQGSQKTESHPTEESVASSQSEVRAPSNEAVDRVKDSFIMPSPEQVEQIKQQDADHFNDALSQAIQETKALAHLPLDEDEDVESPTASAADNKDDSGTDEKPLELAPQPRKKFSVVSKASALRDKNALNLNTFQCMDPGAGGYTSQNPNARTIQILEEMCRHYDQMQDTWRTLAYRKGITTLKKQHTKITTARQAAALPFIGSRLADKIEEIVITDRLRKLDNARGDPLDVVLRLFLGIYGAGLVQANKWIQAGYRTLEDLQTRAKLTASHKVGIEHYDDFNSRIPRAEVEAHGAIVKSALRKINAQFEATVMGSYRRGARDSGDIDMIITGPGASPTTLRTMVFDQLVPQLYKTGFLKASLATSRSTDSTGSKWHGASCLPTSKVWRRMDFLLVPEEEMGAALIYFTGNDIFNRSIRLLARKKNMRLNQRGLYKNVKRGRRGEKLNQGILVEGRSEKKIFEVLGVPWRDPHERIC
ncbi:Nn.00g016600.m01.CDS01 [Neocucurbitaria sp. VM-36]